MTPTLFNLRSAGPMVGLQNKNCIYYAFRPAASLSTDPSAPRSPAMRTARNAVRNIASTHGDCSSYTVGGGRQTQWHCPCRGNGEGASGPSNGDSSGRSALTTAGDPATGHGCARGLFAVKGLSLIFDTEHGHDILHYHDGSTVSNFWGACGISN